MLVDFNCGNHVIDSCELDMLPTSIDSCVDQLVCHVSPLIEELCDLINESLNLVKMLIELVI